MPIHQLQQGIAGPIGGQRVGGGVVAVEPVLSILVGAELAAQVIGGLVVRVLEVVLAVGAGLPDVKDGVGDGLAGEEVGDGAVHEADLAAGGRVLDDGGAVVAEGSVGGPKGAEDGGRGRVDVAFCDDFVGDFVNEAARVMEKVSLHVPADCITRERRYKVRVCYLRFKTENVRHAVRLVARLGRALPDSIDKVHAGHPLVVGQLDLAGKVVQVADQAAQDLAVARRDVGAHGVEDVLGKGGVEARGLRLRAAICAVCAVCGHCV